MAGTGYAQKVYVLGKDDQPLEANEGGIKTQHAFPQYLSFRFRVTNVEGGTSLPDIPCSLIVIRNSSTPTSYNEPVYIGGIGQNAMDDDSMFLLDGESTQIPVDHANKITLYAETTLDVRVIIYPSTLTEVNLANVANINLSLTDTVAPTAQSINPANGATGVARNTDITVTMSEAIDPATVTTSSYTISPAPPAPGTWNVFLDPLDPAKLILNPDSTLAGTTVYTITVTTSVKDLQGNPLASNYVNSFTTTGSAPGADVTAPLVLDKDPDSGETNVIVGKVITIVFNEDINVATISATTVKFTEVITTNTVPATIALGADKRTLTITPTTSLDYAKAYQVQLTTGIQDIAGNAFAGTTWQFNTEAESYTIVYNVTGSSDNKLGASYSNFIGVYLANSSSDLVNVAPTKVVFKLHKVGSPTGTLTVNIFNGPTFVKTLGSLDVATLTTSSKEYTFIDALNTTELLAGYSLTMGYNGGDSSNYVVVKRNESNPFDGTNTYEIEEDGAGGTDFNTGYDTVGKIYVSP